MVPVLPVYHVAFLVMIIKLELEVLRVREGLGEPRGVQAPEMSYQICLGGPNAYGPDGRKEQPSLDDSQLVQRIYTPGRRA